MLPLAGLAMRGARAARGERRGGELDLRRPFEEPLAPRLLDAPGKAHGARLDARRRCGSATAAKREHHVAPHRRGPCGA